MSKMLLINPRRRRARASAKRRTNPSPAQKRARAAFAAASRARAGRRRRSNPVPALRRPARVRSRIRARRAARRPMGYASNPARRRFARRRRNPISLGSSSSYMSMLKDGLVGGAGAIAVDLAYGYLAPYLPTTLQRTPGSASVGDAVKAIVTIAAGKLLSRATRGLSEKAARGALVVQAHGLIAQMLPNTVTLGYATPSQVANMSTRIGPNRQALARYTSPGATQMLGRYTQPFATQMLASRGRTISREMGAVR